MLPSPARTPVPEKNPDPVSVVPKPARKRKLWPLPVVLTAAAALSAGVWPPLPQHSAPEVFSPADRYARVVRGALERTVRLTGTITTKEFASIAAPMMLGPDAGRELLLVHIAEAGSMVKKIQVIAQIDGQSVQYHLDDIEDQIGQLQ